MSESQAAALAIVPKFSAAVSMIGSAWIIFECVQDRKKLTLAYHRILLAMSIGDWVLSFSSFFLTTWPIPWWEEGVFANKGNMATCQAQGFFVQLSALSSLYNAYLATYYVLIVRYNWKEPDIKKFEYGAHIFTFLFSLGTAIAAVPLTLYNNYVNALCWISESPQGCVGDECVRGENAIAYQYAFYFVWIWGSLIVVTIMMVVLYSTVHQQTERNRRYTTNAEMPASSRRTRKQVSNQAFLYISAYYLVNLFPTIQLIIKSITGGGYFAIYFLNGFFFPMQGMFNAIIYLRPRYLRYKQEQPSASFSSLLGQTLGKPLGGISCCGGITVPNSMRSSVRNFNARWSTRGSMSSTIAGNPRSTRVPERFADDYKLGTMYEADDDVANKPPKEFDEEKDVAADDDVANKPPKEFDAEKDVAADDFKEHGEGS